MNLIPESDAATRGLVFNIQKYSVHDGPGIRTIVFFKGCPLSCRWCSNPESQSRTAELGYNSDKCLGCGACAAACVPGALTLTSRGVRLNRAACRHADLPCVAACPSGALALYGSWRTVQDVLDEVDEDSVFYTRSGGGLTLSGGEALNQPAFALALLREAKRRRVHRALETCALAQEALVLEAASLLDYLLVDVKCMDSALHAAFTGAGNERILSNIRAVRGLFPNLYIHVRTPVVPGFNDNRDAIAAIAAFAAEVGAQRYELLPYHRMGEQKYRFLGQDSPMGAVELDQTVFEGLKNLAMN